MAGLRKPIIFRADSVLAVSSASAIIEGTAVKRAALDLHMCYHAVRCPVGELTKSNDAVFRLEHAVQYVGDLPRSWTQLLLCKAGV